MFHGIEIQNLESQNSGEAVLDAAVSQSKNIKVCGAVIFDVSFFVIVFYLYIK